MASETPSRSGLRRRVPGKDAGADTTAEDSDPKLTGGVAKHSAPGTSRFSGLLAKSRPWLVPGLLTAVSLWTHWYRIGEAKYIVWDEAHFAKFQNYYRLATFYTDLHPNLGKSLLGLPGFLAGYPGLPNFDFGSERGYPDDKVAFVQTRMFCGLLGALMVPLAYATCSALGCSSRGSFLGGLVILCDMALLTITRFILLDPPLLFFTSLSVYALCRFRNYRVAPFSRGWWFFLALTGFAIGCVASVKWIGLFTVAVVGLYTIADLWNLMGDSNVSNREYLNHWLARILCLIVFPFFIYALVFYLHFAILYKSGPGDAQMHPLFQADLQGNEWLISGQHRAVAYGTQMTLRSLAPWGGLLHSHVQTYPKKDSGGHGSGQQQVTGYHHFDDNNNFRFERRWPTNQQERDLVASRRGKVQYVRDGDVVRIVHWNTKKNLHSHNIKAPMSLWANEVSGYGEDSEGGDPNDHWIVDIVGDVDESPPPKDRFTEELERPVVRPVTTRFRLRHAQTGCHLSYHNVILPDWGFKQYEIVCRKGNPDSLGSQIEWSVERITDSRLAKPSGNETSSVKVPSRISFSNFWKYFYGVNLGMHATNNLLTPEPGKPPSPMESDPETWPLATVGMRMSGWGDHNLRYYLLGNIVVWRGSVGALVLLLVLAAIYTVAWRRGWMNDKQRILPAFSDAEFGNFIFAAIGIGVVGYLMHYVPFFTVKRVTYLHHHLPALYYGAIALAYASDHVLTHYIRNNILRTVIFAAECALIIGVFVYFRDCSFGMTGPTAAYKGRQWLSTWAF
ncbi:Dolichyl-phosphate-mannose-protein mannosyltransferase-domain-containing protein [Hyaloraphidium curvatum]|nr:Dolichyl-phosphate-mannose-protein mannosyltransferase-domain-containing protein [Hyaloraphidium curvatum]